jgi:flagellar hook-associated protein 2
MAGITASGIGSGLDITSLVSQLMTLEQRPLTLLQAKESSYQAKLSAYGQLKASLSSFQTAADALTKPAKFSATKATVADSTILSATTGTAATTGTFSVKVNDLASSQRTATSAITEFAPLAGDLTITFGTVAGGIFNADSGSAKTLSFAGGTLEDLRNAINDGDLGVSASVINNGAVKQLVITSKDTGAAQAFSISGTAGLSYDPASTTTSTDPVYGVQAAQNASLEVDGILISRSSNVIDDVIDGVTLNLAKTSGSATTVAVTADASGAKSAIESFVANYNNLISTIKTLTAYDAEKDSAATLTGDSTIRAVQGQMRSLISGEIGGLSGASRLSAIGITLGADGKLTVNSGDLEAALADPSKDVGALFAGTDSIDGLGTLVSNQIDSFLDSGGLLSARTDGINSSIKSLKKQEDAWALRLEKIEARYRTQFTNLDTLMASMTQTSNYLTQQLANLPQISSGN